MANVIVVQSGDSVWEIAKRVLKEEHGRVPRSEEIAVYSRKIIELNRSHGVTVDSSSEVNAEAAKAFMQKHFNAENNWQLYPGIRLFVPGDKKKPYYPPHPDDEAV